MRQSEGRGQAVTPLCAREEPEASYRLMEIEAYLSEEASDGIRLRVKEERWDLMYL